MITVKILDNFIVLDADGKILMASPTCCDHISVPIADDVPRYSAIVRSVDGDTGRVRIYELGSLLHEYDLE